VSHPGPYIRYTHRFFARWLPVYDWFAGSIAHVYRRAARCAGTGSVLDICTGTGEIAVRCARAGAEVTAIDITEPMLRRARRKARGLPIRFLLMDARKLAFPDASFDVAVLSFALHDMPRKVRAQVLAEARRVARRRIVILDYDFPATPVLGGALVRMVASFETAYFPDFAAEGAGALLAQSGLRDVRTIRSFPPLFAIREVTW
jgi:ubiquinone/menaquinone biosynthesis C-methylase UbiE